MKDEIRGYDVRGRPTMKLETAKLHVYECATQGPNEALVLCIRELKKEIRNLQREVARFKLQEIKNEK